MLLAYRDAFGNLVEATALSADGAFNMLHDNNIKFITVTYKKCVCKSVLPEPFECIETLRIGESSDVCTVFLLQLIHMIHNYIGTNKNLK